MSDPVTLDMGTAQPIQAAAPVTLDMSTAQPIVLHAPPAGTIQNLSLDQARNLTDADWQRLEQERLENDRPRLIQAGQMMLGGGGLQNVAEEGGGLLRWLYNNPRVKPVVDAAIQDTLHLPYAKTLKAAWNSFGQPLKKFLTKGAGGALESAEGTEGAAENAAGELSSTQPVAAAQPASTQPDATQPGAAKPLVSAEEVEPERIASGESIPRTLTGESALRQVLDTQPAKTLLQIARARGINVTAEAQLKSDLATPKLIQKIVGDYSEEELDNFRSTYLENTRMQRHDFGDIGKQANQTLNLQTYFPELKIPAAQLKRTQGAIQKAATAKTAPPARTVVIDPATGRPEFSDVLAARGGKPQVPANEDELMDLLNRSLAKAAD